MTAVQTLTFDALDAFVAAHRTAWADLEEKGAIFDGPQVLTPTEMTYAVVGCDDPTQTGMTTALDQGQQDWESLGAYSKTETFTIYCTLVCWMGDKDPNGFSILRADAKTRITDLAATLRNPPAGMGDVTLNDVLSSGRTGWGGLTVNRLRQIADDNGLNLHVAYSFAVTAYI